MSRYVAVESEGGMWRVGEALPDGTTAVVQEVEVPAIGLSFTAGDHRSARRIVNALNWVLEKDVS